MKKTTCEVCGGPLDPDGYCPYHQPVRDNNNISTVGETNHDMGDIRIKDIVLSSIIALLGAFYIVMAILGLFIINENVSFIIKVIILTLIIALHFVRGKFDKSRYFTLACYTFTLVLVLL